MEKIYRCEECLEFVSEKNGITTLSGRWVCDKNSCRDLDNENNAIDKKEVKNGFLDN